MESEVNLTPMLDVVFIMLIFFIVTASFVKEAGIDVIRPAASTAERKERGNILIAITANDQVWMDRRQVNPNALRANIERLHAENPQGSIVIQADKDSKNELLVQVMDAARAAGVRNVYRRSGLPRDLRSLLGHAGADRRERGAEGGNAAALHRVRAPAA
jgi:biopolymer transport protein ExbD